MTKKQVRQKTRIMIKNASKLMREKLEKALICGAVDMRKYDDDFELPKIILHALLKEAAFQYTPLTNNGQRESKNLYLHI